MNPQPRSANSLAMAFRNFLKSRRWTPDSTITANLAAWGAPALAAILVLALGSWLAASLNIWIDEAYTIHTTGRGIGYAFEQASTFELQPPLYFLFVAAWRLVDETSVAFARLPSVVFAACAAAIIVVAARRAAPRVPSVAVALVTALNPIIVWASAEMRVYSLVLLVSAALTLAFIDGFLVDKPSQVARGWYVVAGIVGLYTQFYVGFLLLAFVLTVVALRRRELRSFLLVNIIIGLAFLPFVSVALKIVHDANSADVRQVSLLKALHEMVNANFVYVLPHEIGWTGYDKIVGFSLAAALAALLVFVGKPRTNRIATALLVSWSAASLIFSLIFAIAGEAPDIRRHAVAIAPITLLSAYAVLSGLQTRRRTLSAIAALVFALFASGSLWWLYRPPLSKTGDWQRLATVITTWEPNVPVIIFPSNLALALGRYLPAQVRLVPFPEPMPFSADYLHAMTLHDQAQVAHSFRTAGIAHTSLWIVSDNSCDPGPQIYDFSCRYLESYMQAHYTLRKTYLFHGSVASLYEPRSRSRHQPHS